MPRVRSWPCLLLAASLSFAASPEASGVDLFGGFDELRNSTTGNTCVGSKQGNASELASFSFKDNMKVVSSRKELSQELELNAQVTAVVGGANTQTKASMLNKFSRKSNSLYFLYNASAYSKSGLTVYLMALSAALARLENWNDPRAERPWISIATALLRFRESLEVDAGGRLEILYLAEDLLTAPRMRVRGISPQRILEGMLFHRLAGLSDSR